MGASAKPPVVDVEEVCLPPSMAHRQRGLHHLLTSALILHQMTAHRVSSSSLGARFPPSICTRLLRGGSACPIHTILLRCIHRCYCCMKNRGKCSESWMINGSFCKATCGRCGGGPSAPTKGSQAAGPAPSSDQCSDTPPNDGTSCIQQLSWCALPTIHLPVQKRSMCCLSLHISCHAPSASPSVHCSPLALQ
jgi:hypothetical protein